MSKEDNSIRHNMIIHDSLMVAHIIAHQANEISDAQGVGLPDIELMKSLIREAFEVSDLELDDLVYGWIYLLTILMDSITPHTYCEAFTALQSDYINKLAGLN